MIETAYGCGEDIHSARVLGEYYEAINKVLSCHYYSKSDKLLDSLCRESPWACK